MVWKELVKEQGNQRKPDCIRSIRMEDEKRSGESEEKRACAQGFTLKSRRKSPSAARLEAPDAS
jgi:hypothetical protein